MCGNIVSIEKACQLQWFENKRGRQTGILPRSWLSSRMNRTISADFPIGIVSKKGAKLNKSVENHLPIICDTAKGQSINSISAENCEIHLLMLNKLSP